MAPMKRPAVQSVAGQETCSLAEAAKRLRVSQRELRAMLSSRQLDFVQWRGKFRIPREQIERLEKVRV